MTTVLVAQVIPDWANNWLMPFWLLALGAIAGLLVLLVLWLLAWVVGAAVKPVGVAARESGRIVQEGPLAPLLWIAGGMVVLGAVGFFLLRNPGDILQSLARMPVVGDQAFAATVPPTKRDELGEPDPAGETAIQVDFERRELGAISIEASENLLVFATPFDPGQTREGFDVAAGVPYSWTRTAQNVTVFPEGRVSELYVVNRGSQEADLELVVTTRPASPEVRTVPIVAVSLVAVVLLYFLQSLLMPRLSAVALATFKSEVAQPLFAILLGLGLVLLFVFLIVPYHTLGEDIKMLKDNGLTLIMVLAMVQAVWAAGTSVSEEVEGRTALTVLSKPITRRAFIAGKFAGILWTVLLLFVILGLWFLLMVSYKPVYDSRENSAEEPTWQVCHQEMAETVPGLTLSFLETVVMASLAVAISTRLPMLANMVICLSIYTLGHLTPVLVQSSAASEQFEVVIFIAQLIATVFPNLESFNISPAVAGGVEVPWIYLVYALAYCLVYSLIAMLLALLLFEDRDLA